MVTRGPIGWPGAHFSRIVLLPRDHWGWLILFLLGEACLPDPPQLSWRSESLSFQVRDATQGKSSGFLGCMGQGRVRRQGAVRKTAGWACSKQKQEGQLRTPVSKPLDGMYFVSVHGPVIPRGISIYRESVFCSLLTFQIVSFFRWIN